MTLTDFLLQRIAEDEAVAHYAQTRDAVDDRSPGGWGGWWLGHYQYYHRHDPARVLAECEAKRRIVEAEDMRPVRVEKPMEFAQRPDTATNSYVFTASQEVAIITALQYRQRFGREAPPSTTLRALASVYADHPDYDESWRP